MLRDLTVACVLKSGGIYTAEWVRRLRDGVSRHLSIPHRFVCLSDVDVPCERIRLAEPWRGWWSKINLFAPGQFDGTVLYLDLDTLIVGSLDLVADHMHHFTMAHDWYHGHACSTAMCWRGDYSFIWEEFKRSPASIAKHYDGLLRTERRIGDQAFIEDQLTEAGIAPEIFRDVTGPRFIASYKVDQCEAGPPEGAAAVAFHGKPKPHEIKHGWVSETWR